MYRNACQRGLLTILHAGGADPLSIWDTYTQDGWISRFLDQDIKSMVLEIGGNNVSTSYVTCPKGKKTLGIAMPFLVMVVKNLKKYFSFEVTILDDTGVRRRFRASNFQSNTQIMPLCTAMPIGLTEGWNQIQFNLAEFTRRAYKKQYIETQKVKINANIRIRRVYFAERLLPEDQLPTEYKLFFPLSSKKREIKRVEEPVPLAAVEERRISSVKRASRTSVHTSEVAPEVPPQNAAEVATDALAGEQGLVETEVHTAVEGIELSAAEESENPDGEETNEQAIEQASVGVDEVKTAVAGEIEPAAGEIPAVELGSTTPVEENTEATAVPEEAG